MAGMFPVGYQPAQIYYPQQVGTQMSLPQQRQQEPAITWVQGEAGAKSYMVAPGATVTLWDTESQTIYIKSADAVGIPSMKILDYTIRDNTPNSPTGLATQGFATKDDVDYLKNEIASLRAKFERIGKDGDEK